MHEIIYDALTLISFYISGHLGHKGLLGNQVEEQFRNKCVTKLIFYENNVSLLQAFDNTRYHLQEAKKNEMN